MAIRAHPMGDPVTLVELGARWLPDGAGRKAVHLSWLIRAGFRVPAGFVIPAEIAAAAARDEEARAALERDLAERVDPDRGYAVRSSANVEDALAHSFAGQFLSVLDVTGPAAIAQATVAVSASVRAERVMRYAEVADVDPRAILMGVVVQEMVRPVVSGVAFSRNPLTGLDEVVIEALPGRGDALVQDGANPDRWIHRWGDLVERPDVPRTDPALIAAVARETRRIADRFGAPVDVEWVWDGAAVSWVQLRPIGGLDDIPIYSNRIAREVLPGIIRPLVWSVNVPIVNRAWVELFTEAIGPNEIDPDRLARAFSYRAYFDMRAIGDIFAALGMPRASLELLLGLPAGSERPRFRGSRRTLRHVPRMLRLMRRLNRFDRRLERQLPVLEERARRLAATNLGSLDEPGLIAHVGEITRLTREAAYPNIVGPLLMNAYGALVRRRVARHGLDPVRVDPARDEPGIHDHDPRAAMADLATLTEALGSPLRRELREHGLAALDRGDAPAGAAASAFRAAFDGFIARFGHLSDSGNDLSQRRWREDPDLVLRMVLDAPPRAAGDSLAWADVRDRIPAWERPILGRIFRRAATFRRQREWASSAYTFGYGLFRPAFLELAGRLVGRGAIAVEDDVFYLTLDELREIVARGNAGRAGDGSRSPIGESTATLVARRRAEVADAEHAELPEIILGDDYVARRRGNGADIRELRGVPSSRGTFRGPVRVIRSSAEFDRMTDGAVLVVTFSDVAWTPLFARAGAVVAEAGGMLSHSSIVARERGIPCVVSVPGATDLPDGTWVHVDGYRGVVSVEEP